MDKLANRGDLEKALPEIGLTLKAPSVAPMGEQERAAAVAAMADESIIFPIPR